MNSIILSVAFCLILAATQIYGQDQYYGKQEKQCLQQGGLCIQESQCESLLGARNELCPQQAAQGFQCCLGLPKSETRCQKRGGECKCKNSCNKRIVYSKASDCANDEECCILVL